MKNFQSFISSQCRPNQWMIDSTYPSIFNVAFSKIGILKWAVVSDKAATCAIELFTSKEKSNSDSTTSDLGWRIMLKLTCEHKEKWKKYANL